MNSFTGNTNTGASSNNPLTGGGNPLTGNHGAGAGNKDYGDKAFDALAKKSGHNVGPSTGEKITDGARGVFEKVTGKKVDPKYSN
ncbi:hypothetical protein GE09DRAFT_1230588 [Coniochaeta sp. 2T2.1]|nr:hypothetical protein GE09DRAFT_1230588 [Coniochaeta sp. 2T2.1]